MFVNVVDYPVESVWVMVSLTVVNMQESLHSFHLHMFFLL